MLLTATLKLLHQTCRGITNTPADIQLRQNPDFRGFIINYVINLTMLLNEPKIN